MKIFLNKQRVAIALLSYLATFVALVYLVIFPLLDKIRSMNDQIQQEGMKQEMVRLNINELPKIQKQYQALQDGGDFSGILLDKNKAVILIEKLEKLAESTDNEIAITVEDNVPVKKTAATSPASVADGIIGELPNKNYLQMKIILNGDYNSIVKFIDLLENFEYYADIVAVQIDSEKDSSKQTQSSLSTGMFGIADQVAAARSSNGDSEKKLDIPGKDRLTSSLDIVFYTN